MEQKEIKKALRQQVRDAIKGMTEEQRKAECQHIWQELAQCEEFQQAQTVLLYWSLDNEVDTHSFVEEWSKKKTLLLPVVNGDELDLKVFEGTDKMKVGAYGILEPQGELWTNPGQIDLCVVPGVVFDQEGHRMGHGKGYYDRLLATLKCARIGVGYACQMVEKLPHEPWDQDMTRIIVGK